MRQHAWYDSFPYWEWFFAVSTAIVAALVWAGSASVGTAIASSAWMAALVVWYLVLGRRLILIDLSVTEVDGRLAHLYRLGVLVLFVALALTDRNGSLTLLVPIVAHLFWIVPLWPSVPVLVALNLVPALVDVVDGEPVGTVLETLAVCAATAALSVALGVFIVRVIDQSVDRFELIEELKDSRAEVERLSHEAGVAAERRRLGTELHDTVTQGLSSIIMLVQAARTADDERREEHLDLIERTARANLAEARAMVEALAVDDAGAVQAETALAELAEAAGASFEVEGEPRHLAPAKAVALVRAVQEALRNVDKHAAGADVRVRLAYRESDVAVSVADDGPGFDPGAPSSGFGLLGARNRMIGLGGAFEVDTSPGAGTTVRLEVPA
ncbi:sensor histidine kinase [Glycomyces arizonensis]|uniref:sensor histidine kinase n=1 Tax=Glycomyces arizonensis TaxID=256035 RepID=UPI00041AC292|nr:sensor histidine kinase [Glycomyces arizonensis]